MAELGLFVCSRYIYIYIYFSEPDSKKAVQAILAGSPFDLSNPKKRGEGTKGTAYYWLSRHCVNALFCRAVTSILSQRSLRKIQGTFDSSSSRSFNAKTQPRNSILRDTFVECVCRNSSCAQGERSLHSR